MTQNKVSKHYRLHQSDLDLIKNISTFKGGISATRVIEKALMFYAVKLDIPA